MADNEKEVVIKISAKNLTSAEFEKARKDLAGLGDQSVKNSKDAEKAIKDAERLGATIGETMKVTAQGIAIAGAAIGAAALAVVELGKRGADVADIKGNFDLLNRAMGVDSSAAIKTLTTAVDGTVSKFDLMKATNIALSQGLRVTDSDYRLLGESSRVLADRTGGDTKSAFETLTMAMATGQDRALKGIGLNIDATKAVEDYARSLGVEAGELDESQQKHAKQNAILAELKRVMGESGRATIDFGDAIAIGTTKIQDFTDDLAEAIANSPVLGAALSAVGDVFKSVFGSDTQGAIRSIVGFIEQSAFVMVEMARTGVGAADLIVRSFHFLQAVFDGVGMAVTRLGFYFAKLIEGVSFVGSYMPGVSAEFTAIHDSAKNAAVTLNGMSEGFAAAGGEALQAAVGTRDSGDAIAKLDAGLVRMKTSMANAAGATGDNTRAAVENKSASEALKGAHQQTASQIKAEEERWKALTERINDSREARNNAVSAVGVSLGGMDILGLMSQSMGNTRLSAEVGKALTASMEEGMKLMPDLSKQAADKMKGLLAKPLMHGMNSVLTTDVPNAILGAIQGGGNPVSAAAGAFGSKFAGNFVEKFGKNITGMFGETIGGAINSFLPGAGALIGPLVGKLAGLLGGIFGGGEESAKVNKPRQQFIDAAGGLEVLNQKVMQATGSLALVQNLLSADKESKYKEAIEGINGALGKFNEELNAGASVSTDLDAAMQKYGLTWKDLGETARTAKLGDISKDLIKDWKTLQAGGVDVAKVMELMKDNVNKFVADARTTGTEIPEAMRPVIQAAIDAGTLFAEDGQQIKDMASSGLNFGLTTQDAMKGVGDSVEHLASVLERFLTGGLNTATGAANSLKTAIDGIPTNKSVVINIDQQGDGVPAFATEAFVRRPTLAVVGDAPGGEFVLRPQTVQRLVDDAASVGAQAGGGGSLEPLRAELQKMRADNMQMIPAMARAVRDGLLMAR